MYLHLPDFPFYPFHDVVESREVEIGGVESPRSSYLFPGVSYCDPDERPKSPAETREEDEREDANGCCDWYNEEGGQFDLVGASRMELGWLTNNPELSPDGNWIKVLDTI